MRLITVRSGSSGNCYYLHDDNHYLMLDCGSKISWREILNGCGFHLSKIDGVLCTHWHADHLGHIRDLNMSAIPFFSCPEVIDKYDELLHVVALNEKSAVTIRGGWVVIPWYVPHTGNDGISVPCYAYLIQSPNGHRTVYLTDFLYSRVTFKNYNVNTILIACNHDDDIEEYENSEKYDHIVSGHSSLSVVNEIIRVNQTDALRHVILCHLSEENATPSLMVRTINETVGENVTVDIARKGFAINL